MINWVAVVISPVLQDAKFAKVSLNPIHDHDFRELLKPNDPLDKGFIVEAVNVGRGDYWKDPIELRYSIKKSFKFSMVDFRTATIDTEFLQILLKLCLIAFERS